MDLIFGYKQRGPYAPGGSEAAVEAVNTYFHVMYEGSADLEKLAASNPGLFASVRAMIEGFGQIPPQLFNKPVAPQTSYIELFYAFPLVSRWTRRCQACAISVGLQLQERPPE